MGARYRVGPELEICGYGCEDHFLENDTLEHCWECLADLLAEDVTVGILCDIGMPLMYGGVRYNCRVFVLDRKILLVRPKMCLADDGNYRESRWFTAWQHRKTVLSLRLPSSITSITGQLSVPFGDAALQFSDGSLGSETCEELFTPAAPHIDLALNGVEIISNGSGSHHQLRKLDKRMDLIQSATSKAGGIYLYANQRGCDGGRLYYDGCACIVVNGNIVAQGEQFAVQEVEVVTANVDLDAVVGFRGAFQSMAVQAASCKRLPMIQVDFCITSQDALPTLSRQVRFHSPEEEIAMGPACWLWDYLRRSGSSGYLLPLSGGADSSSTAAIVGSMCQLVVKAAADGDKQVIQDLRRIMKSENSTVVPSAQKMAKTILTTVYLGSANSSHETRSRAASLAAEIGASHIDVCIDSVVAAVLTFFTSMTRMTPRFRVDGGSQVENLALQNIQARIRMVLSFVLAQLMPWVRGQTGFLLVLGSANVDEGLRGYMTKYDCSSADINPIGGISKRDLRAFLRWGASNLGFPTLASVESAPPTAELEPIRENHVQTDEEDMGMTYDELGVFGRLRNIARLGPVGMFKRLMYEWKDRGTPTEIADKVKRFFYYYSANRHKMTTLTPSYHAENYSPEDNRFDMRPFLYNLCWPWQFKRINIILAEVTEKTQGSE